MARTTADIPPSEKPVYRKLPQASAIEQAEADGYVKTMPMKKAQTVKGSNQYGLPKSTGAMRKVKMKD